MKDSADSNFFRVNYGQEAIRFWAITYLLFYISFAYVDYLAAPVSYTQLWLIRLAIVPFFFFSILSTCFDSLMSYRRLINSLMVFSVPFSITLMIPIVDATEWARYIYFAGIAISVFPIGFILMEVKTSAIVIALVGISYFLVIGVGMDYQQGDTRFFLMTSCFVMTGFAATLLATYLLEGNQRKILEQSDELQALVDLKDRFIRILAHDLRAPCSNVSGFADLYLKDPGAFESKETAHLFHEMKKSATGMQNLLQNLLEWSRLKHSGQLVHPILFKVNDVVQDNIDFAIGAAKLKEITLNSSCSDSELTIYSDVNMISTILRNLISNAIKFSYRGGQILVNFCTQEDFLYLSVKDEGVGISFAIRESLFDVTANNSTPGTSNEPGTGLGLVLCREMAAKCKGEIQVESTEDVGSTFTLKVPIHLKT